MSTKTGEKNPSGSGSVTPWFTPVVEALITMTKLGYDLVKNTVLFLGNGLFRLVEIVLPIIAKNPIASITLVPIALVVGPLSLGCFSYQCANIATIGIGLGFISIFASAIALLTENHTDKDSQ